MKQLDTTNLLHATIISIYKIENWSVIAEKNEDGIIKDKIIRHYNKQLSKLREIEEIILDINKI